MLKEIIKKHNAENQANVDLFKQVRSHLESFSGKKITKRVETKLSKEMPGYNISYKKEWGSHCLSVWESDFNKRKTFYLGEDYFSLTLFDKKNACYGSAAQDRINLNNKFLNDSVRVAKLNAAIESYKTYKGLISEFNHVNLPAFFDIKEELVK